MPVALRLVAWLMGGISLVWAMLLFHPERGLPALWRERAQLAALHAQTEALRAEARGLRHEIRRLRNDPVAIEAAIHRELGYLYPDELMVIRADGR